MNIFRALLAIMTISIFVYTGFVGVEHGWNLVPIFFGDFSSMNWPGQFNFDFMLMLVISCLWVSWRNRFTPRGLFLGFLALIGGISFLAPYLLWLSYKTNGNLNALLTGRS